MSGCRIERKKAIFILALSLLTAALFLFLFHAFAGADPYVLVEAEEAHALTGEESLVEIEEDPALEISSLSRKSPMLRSAGGLRGGPEASPYEKDGMKINEVTVKWVARSTGETQSAGTGDLNLIPADEDVVNQMFQVEFNIEGQSAHPAGTVEVIIPAYIWLDREGNATGRITLAVPEEPETGAEFAFRRVGDLIYVTNTRRLAPSTRIWFQGSYRDLKTLDLRDVNIDGTAVHDKDPDKADPDGEISRYYADEPGLNGYSKWFWATANLTTTHNEVITRESSNQIRACIDTSATVNTATKATSASYVYMDGTVSSVPADMLRVLTDDMGLDADDYVFVRWYVTGRAKGLQPFTMKLTDTNASTKIMDRQNSTLAHDGGIILGVTGLNACDFDESAGADKIHNTQGTVLPAENGGVTAVLYDGYTLAVRSAYVWAAYPKSLLNDEEFTTVTNTVTLSVRGQDDLQTDTKDATGTVRIKIPAYYHVRKVWDYSSIGSPETLPSYVSQPESARVRVTGGALGSRDYTLNAANEWMCTWSNDGADYNANSYSVQEYSFTPSSGSRAYVPDLTVDGVLGAMWYWYEESAPVYDASTRTWVITNVYKQSFVPYTTYTVDKVWYNSVDGTNVIPEAANPLTSVSGYVRYRSGNNEYAPYSFTLNDGNDWKYSWIDKGYNRSYWVTENTVYPTSSSRSYYVEMREGQKYHVEYWYTTAITSITVDSEAHTGVCTITNTYHENPIPIYTYTVKKTWDDTGVPEGQNLRPASSTIYVTTSTSSGGSTHSYSNTIGPEDTEFSWEAYGKEGSFSVTESTGWRTTTFPDENGHLWRVRYQYRPTVRYDAATRTWNILNKYTAETPIPFTTHTYYKVWAGDSESTARRPETTSYRVRVYNGSTLLRTEYYYVTVADDGASYTVKKDSEVIGTYPMTDAGASFTIADDGYGYQYDIYEYGTSTNEVWTDDEGTTWRQQYWYSPSYGSETYDSTSFAYTRTITNRYSQGRAIPFVTHTVSKEWDFSEVGGRENAAWVPESTSYTLYRGNYNTPITSFTLTGENPSYSWVDEGWDYSYLVSEGTVTNSADGGYTYYNGTWYAGSRTITLDNGKLARLYYRYEPVYGAEDANHNRTVTNRYHQLIVPFRYFTLTKTWADNDNAGLHRAQTQDITVWSREPNNNNYETSRTYNVGTASGPDYVWNGGDQVYEWNDNGRGTVYSVYEYNASRSGYTDYEEIEGGEYEHEGDTVMTPVRRRIRWAYSPGTITSSTRSDGTTTTTDYLVTNLYTESEQKQWEAKITPDGLAARNSTSAAQYTSRSMENDRQVNQLVRGESVVIKFNVSSTEVYNSSNYMTSVLPYSTGEKTRENYVNYGVRPVTVRLENQPSRLFNFNSLQEEYTLGTDDYEIATVTMNPTTVRKWAHSNPWSAWTRTDSDREIVTKLYGQLADGTEVLYATMTNGVMSSFLNGASLEGTTVTLPAGVKKVWTEVETEAGIPEDEISMSYTVGVRILPSDGVLRQIEDAFALSALTNEEVYCELQLTDRSRTVVRGTQSGEEQIKESSAKAWIHGKDYRTAAVLLTKFSYNADSSDHDVIRKIESVHITNTFYQQTNVSDRAEYYNEMSGEGARMVYSSNKGIWYDLLPVGLNPDMSTLSVSGGGEIKWSQTIPNYNESGKTLVIVRVDYPEELRNVSDAETGLTGWRNQHSISFDGSYTWDEIVGYKLINGAPLYHTAVYEALDENELGNMVDYCGEPDTPYGRDGVERNKFSRTLTEGLGLDLATSQPDTTYEEDAHTLTELDPETNAPRFIFRRGSVYFDPELAQVVTVQKLVSVDNINWVKGHEDMATEASDPKAQPISVYEGAPYTYRITVTSENNSWTNNIIIYDYLENYTLDHTEIGESYDGMGRWKGYLENIDLNQIRSLGCDPVVYYSTVTDMELFRGYASDDPETVIAPPPLPDFAEPGSENTFWSTTPPADIGSVTAIAVDCTRLDASQPLSEDNMFWLSEDDVMELFIHMRAPLMNNTARVQANDAGEREGDGFEPKAYNNTGINYEFISSSQQNGYEYHFAYTQIELKPFPVTVVKEWQDDNDRDGLRPDQIVMRLLANGVPAVPERTVTLSPDAEGKWEGGFESLPMYDASGRWINYTLEEITWIKDGMPHDPDPRYVLEQDSVQGEGNLAFRAVNRYTPERIDLPFVKTWTGEELGERPESITVRLLADGEFSGKTLTVTPDANKDWLGAFRNLLRYRDHGVEIVYTVEEDDIENYYPSYGEEFLPASSAEGAPTRRLTITNTFYPFGHLKVAKSLAGDATVPARNVDFTFSLTLLDADGEYLQDKYDYEKYADNGTPEDASDDVLLESSQSTDTQLGNGDEFKLKDGQYLIVKDIPVGSRYTVTELNQTAFTQISAEGSSGRIRSMRTAEASFVNQYAAEGTASIALRKELRGREMLRGQFRFQMTAGQRSETSGQIEAVGEVLRYASNLPPDADSGLADVIFSPLVYTQADVAEQNPNTFYYIVSEIHPDPLPSGYDYSDDVYYVQVTVRDESGRGELETEVKYYADPSLTSAVAAPCLVNNYTATGRLQLDVWKILRYGELAPEAYSFQLLELTADTVEPGETQTYTLSSQVTESRRNDEGFTAQNQNDRPEGKVSFTPLLFTLDGDHRIDGQSFCFAVREDTSAPDPDVEYDEKILCFRVTVTDNGDGTLGFDQAVFELIPAEGEGMDGKYVLCAENGTPTAAEPVFYNAMKPGRITVTKYTDGTGDENKSFPFRVLLTGQDIPTTPEEGLTVTITPAEGGNNTAYVPPTGG